MLQMLVIVIFNCNHHSVPTPRPIFQVNLNLQESEVNHALQDAALLSSVLEAGL